MGDRVAAEWRVPPVRVHALVVTRNEAGRWLAPMLEWTVAACSGAVVVFDDQSTDDTRDVARAAGALVEVRPTVAASFLEHEGRFRQTAWDVFADSRANPGPGDWVLAVDADEFLVPKRRDVPIRLAVSSSCWAAERDGLGVLDVGIPEVWSIDPRWMVRTDGMWAGNVGPRLCAWSGDTEFSDRAMGCGSLPLWTRSMDVGHGRACFDVLHLGYARARDRRAKAERYGALENHGHNDSHIGSILRPPRLAPWLGPKPAVLA